MPYTCVPDSFVEVVILFQLCEIASQIEPVRQTPIFFMDFHYHGLMHLSGFGGPPIYNDIVYLGTTMMSLLL